MIANAWPEPPGGFVLRADHACALYVAASEEVALRERGLETWEGWERVLAAGSVASGRGATAVVGGGSHARWRLKHMRRGGRLASAWRDRYPSAHRLVETLSASVEAQRRGVRTPDPIAVIVRAEAGGFVRGAMAFEEIERSEDLARRVVHGVATPADLTATIEAVREMHDRGVSHPDLNLGNVLLRSRPEGPPEVWIIDFDRATFTDGPLGFTARQAALRRLERSCAKLTGSAGPWGPASADVWYDTYARDDAELARRLAAGRRWGRIALAIHRMGWRRNST